MIEEILKDALQQVDGLAGKVYKLAAPKDATAPYAVLANTTTPSCKTWTAARAFGRATWNCTCWRPTTLR